MYTNISPDALFNARRILQAQAQQGPLMTTYAAPIAPPSSMPSTSMLAPAIGAVVLGAAGYFLMPRHAVVAALGGAVVGGLAGYLAFPAPAAAAPAAGPGPSKF
jgi:hypothetical protein